MEAWPDPVAVIVTSVAAAAGCGAAGAEVFEVVVEVASAVLTLTSAPQSKLVMVNPVGAAEGCEVAGVGAEVGHDVADCVGAGAPDPVFEAASIISDEEIVKSVAVAGGCGAAGATGADVVEVVGAVVLVTGPQSMLSIVKSVSAEVG